MINIILLMGMSMIAMIIIVAMPTNAIVISITTITLTSTLIINNACLFLLMTKVQDKTFPTIGI